MVINSFTGEYRWLSNFQQSPISYSKYTFPTVENAYQAAKCKNVDDMIDFTIMSPGEAKRQGRLLNPMIDNWDNIKLNIMRKLINLKFSTGSYLSDKLIETGDIEIIEGNTWNDVYWGVCNNKGENHLGLLIMKQRDILNTNSNQWY